MIQGRHALLFPPRRCSISIPVSNSILTAILTSFSGIASSMSLSKLSIFAPAGVAVHITHLYISAHIIRVSIDISNFTKERIYAGAVGISLCLGVAHHHEREEHEEGHQASHGCHFVDCSHSSS